VLSSTLAARRTVIVGWPPPDHVTAGPRCEGWTRADIGAALNMSESGVSRAIQRLTGDSNVSEDW
jgi:hypothetical protein